MRLSVGDEREERLPGALLPPHEIDRVVGEFLVDQEAFLDVIHPQVLAGSARLLDAVDELGLRENTIFIFTSDNGPEFQRAWFGFSGPWRGTYFTGLEASLRVPFLVRWPGKVPAGRRTMRS